MSERTAIGWTRSTWNPWHGCHKVSPGCKHCYMFTAKRRYGQDPEMVVRSKTTFRDPLKWQTPRLIFTCSWSDFFIREADPWRDEAWTIIQATPHHLYQILTKRPHRMRGRLPWGATPWPHVWLGVSVELTTHYGRIEELVRHPAAGHFLSLEPLLGPLPNLPLEGIDWVIVGGESGPEWREHVMDLAWLSEICDQCRLAGVPLFVKQDSGLHEGRQGRISDDLWSAKDIPRALDSLRAAEFPA